MKRPMRENATNKIEYDLQSDAKVYNKQCQIGTMDLQIQCVDDTNDEKINKKTIIFKKCKKPIVTIVHV